MNLFIFGMGYTAQVLAKQLRAKGWQVRGTGRAGDVPFADAGAVSAAVAAASHVLSSVPPAREGGDPVLASYADLLRSRAPRWLGYLSATGVYGDTGGAWVDESAPVGAGRRTARADADLAWQELGAHILRLPGIYGPGRSALDRVRMSVANRIDLPEQVFSRVHVDDIAAGVIAAFAGPVGVYNLADDLPCSQNMVIEEAARLMGLAPPPLKSLAEAQLSPMALGFYAENRRIANGKAKRVLGWQLRYPTYREGLRALNATSNPANASADPASARNDQ